MGGNRPKRTQYKRENVIKQIMSEIFLHIMKTCPCNVYPLEPHFYIAKLGYAGVYLFFLFLLQNIDCGVPTIYVLSKNKKNIKIFLLKILIFYNFENLYILHEQVFVMNRLNFVCFYYGNIFCSIWPLIIE